MRMRMLIAVRLINPKMFCRVRLLGTRSCWLLPCMRLADALTDAARLKQIVDLFQNQFHLN